MGNHIWGYWDCPYCGTKGIRGDNRKCTYCGIQIPPDTKYYIKQDVHEEVEQSKLDSAAHWICEYCDTQNPAAANYCTNCGSPRSDARRDYFGRGLNGAPDRPPQPVQEPIPAPAQAYTPRQNVSPAAATNTRSASDFFVRHKKKLIIGLVLLFLIWLFVPITRTAEVTGFEWERSIAIQEYRNVDESDWSLPQNANLHRTAQEVKSHRQVLDHYETRTRQVAKQVPDGYDTDYRDLGNGQFEEIKTPRYRTEYETETYQEPVYRNEPVYATKYYYDIDKWVDAGSSRSSGCDHEPYWRETGNPPASSNPRLGDRRDGKRTEEYCAVIKTAKGGEERKKYSLTEWKKLSVGDRIEYKTFRFSQKPLN